MRNLVAVTKECMHELDNIGIKYGNIVAIKPNTRAHKRWGQCKMVPNGYEININIDLLDERNSENGLKNTIIHELLHSCDGCMNHGEKWKNMADLVNYHYGYNIKRTSSEQEKGIVYSRDEENIYPDYVLKCTKCGAIWHRQRKVKFVVHPENFRCSCGGEIIRIK